MEFKARMNFDPEFIEECRKEVEEGFLNGDLSPFVQEIMDVIILVKEQKRYINDTTGETCPIEGIVSIGLKEQREVGICPVTKGSVDTLRPLYIKDHVLHLAKDPNIGLWADGSYIGPYDLISESWF